MKKFLISTALVASMGFAGAAFAQTATPVTNAAGEPLYTWTTSTGAIQQGNIGAYNTFVSTLPTPSAPVAGATAPTYDYGGANYPTQAAAVAAYNRDVAARQELVTSVVALVEGEQNNSLAGNQASLLEDLLSRASTIQSSLANTSENLGDINGSINLDMTRFDAALPDVVAGTSTNGATISEPITAKIGNLTTTVIGSLGTGDISSTANLSSIEDLNQAMTNTSQALNAQFTNGPAGAGPAGLQQIYNLSSNLGALDASVNVNLSGVSLASAENIPGVLSTNATINSIDSKMATWSTTAIGSLGDGKVTSTLTNNATALTERLVGSN